MELTSQDIETIKRAALKNFSLEQLQGGGWLERPFDAEIRKALGRIDLEFFAHFYLPHHFTKPSAPFHEGIFDAVDTRQMVSTAVSSAWACLLPFWG